MDITGYSCPDIHQSLGYSGIIMRNQEKISEQRNDGFQRLIMNLNLAMGKLFWSQQRNSAQDILMSNSETRCRKNMFGCFCSRQTSTTFFSGLTSLKISPVNGHVLLTYCPHVFFHEFHHTAMEFPMILSDFPTPSDKLSRQTKVTWGTCFFDGRFRYPIFGQFRLVHC